MFRSDSYVIVYDRQMNPLCTMERIFTAYKVGSNYLQESGKGPQMTK